MPDATPPPDASSSSAPANGAPPSPPEDGDAAPVPPTSADLVPGEPTPDDPATSAPVFLDDPVLPGDPAPIVPSEEPAHAPLPAETAPTEAVLGAPSALAEPPPPVPAVAPAKASATVAAIIGLPNAPVVRDEAARRAALARMKRIALGALVGAAVGFVVLRVLLRGAAEGSSVAFWGGLLEAFFEASMVGALADWFAVTALFRYPLGLKIPHTAIIPTRKDRIGEALARFVGQHFLSPENVLPRLERINFAEIVGAWLKTPGNVRSLREKVVGAIEGAIDGLGDDRITDFATREVMPRLKDVALAGNISDLLLGLAKDGQHEDLLDELLRGAASVAAANREAIHDVVRRQLPGFVPGFVVDLMTDAVMQRIDDTVTGMLSDREHPLRLKVHERVRGFIERLDTDEEMQGKVNAFRDRILESPALTSFAVERWADFKLFLTRDLHDPESEIFAFLEARGADLGGSMLEDDAFQDAVNEKVEGIAAWAIREHGGRIPDLIRDTINRWDPERVSEQIELAVGRDLQYIRINGTLVGGLVGVILYLVTAWVG